MNRNMHRQWIGHRHRDGNVASPSPAGNRVVPRWPAKEHELAASRRKKTKSLDANSTKKKPILLTTEPMIGSKHRLTRIRNPKSDLPKSEGDLDANSANLHQFKGNILTTDEQPKLGLRMNTDRKTDQPKFEGDFDANCTNCHEFKGKISTANHAKYAKKLDPRT